MAKRKQSSSEEAVKPDPVWKEKKAMLRLLAGFALLLLVFYAIYSSSAFNEFILKPCVSFQAKLSSFILNLFGQNTTADGTQLMGTSSTLNVAKGCDGMEATALYLIGVLLMPFSWSSKWRGLWVGLCVLFALNLLRIILLYFSNAYWPSAFEFLHLHGGFVLFMVISIFMWAKWTSWAMTADGRILDSGR